VVRPRDVRIAVLVLLLSVGTAAASPPLFGDDDLDWREDRAFFEWSTWIRLGYGVERVPVDTIARATSPQQHDQRTAWDVALGANLTIPLPTSRVRLGPWFELRPKGVFAGGELNIAGDELDMFQYGGERVYSLRAGSSMTDITGAFAVGYRCPWKLWGPYNRATRYMIGARLVASATRSVIDPDDWSMSLGLEFEPVGSLRYLAMIRSWY
jgi:hypothetical protein